MDIVYAAQAHSLDEFLDAYDSCQANTEVNGRSVLMGALTNVDPSTRGAIASRLLDDGADATTAHGDVNVLHALLGNAALDPGLEAPLLRRLLDQGADVNAPAIGYGTPLQLLMSQFAYTDEALAPLYDVLFARGDLDLLMIGGFEKSTYAMAVKSRRRQGLRSRMDQYLDVHGIEIPEVVRGSGRGRGRTARASEWQPSSSFRHPPRPAAARRPGHPARPCPGSRRAV